MQKGDRTISTRGQLTPEQKKRRVVLKRVARDGTATRYVCVCVCANVHVCGISLMVTKLMARWQGRNSDLVCVFL